MNDKKGKACEFIDNIPGGHGSCPEADEKCYTDLRGDGENITCNVYKGHKLDERRLEDKDNRDKCKTARAALKYSLKEMKDKESTAVYRTDIFNSVDENFPYDSFQEDGEEEQRLRTRIAVYEESKKIDASIYGHSEHSVATLTEEQLLKFMHGGYDSVSGVPVDVFFSVREGEKLGMTSDVHEKFDEDQMLLEMARASYAIETLTHHFEESTRIRMKLQQKDDGNYEVSFIKGTVSHGLEEIPFFKYAAVDTFDRIFTASAETRNKQEAEASA
jgi:hypothetical protein